MGRKNLICVFGSWTWLNSHLVELHKRFHFYTQSGAKHKWGFSCPAMTWDIRLTLQYLSFWCFYNIVSNLYCVYPSLWVPRSCHCWYRYTFRLNSLIIYLKGYLKTKRTQSMFATYLTKPKNSLSLKKMQTYYGIITMYKKYIYKCVSVQV